MPCDLLPFEETLSSDKRNQKSKSRSYHRKKNSVDSEISGSDSSCDYNVHGMVPDEVTESFPVSQQTTPLVDSSSYDQEVDYSDNQDDFQLIQISKLFQMILKNSTVKKLMRSRTLKS